MFDIRRFIFLASILAVFGGNARNCSATPILYLLVAPDYGTFQYTSPDFIQTDVAVVASRLDFCTVVSGVCWPDDFFIGGNNVPAVVFFPTELPSSAIDFSSVVNPNYAISLRFYFPTGSFTTPGVYATPPEYGSHSATLSVTAVAEPPLMIPMLAVSLVACGARFRFSRFIVRRPRS
jgi:hypothetical protein